MFSNIAESIGLKRKDITRKEVQRLYERDLPSFADILPYSCYDQESKTFVLEDAFSRAAVFTITPTATEARATNTLVKLRDKIKDMLEQAFEEKSVEEGRWVIQQYAYEDPRIYQLADVIRDYCRPHAKGTEFSEHYVEIMRKHLKGLNKSGGIFFDDEVTNSPFSGKYRRCKLVIYRRCNNKELRNSEFCPIEELNEVTEQAMKILEHAGFKYERDDAREFFSWVVRHLNPKPDYDDAEKFYQNYEDIIEREATGELPIKGALREALVGNPPRSSVEDNCWYFDEMPSRFLRIAGSRNPPRIGQLTGEVSEGEGENAKVECTLDKLPPNSILASTTVICSQADFELLIKDQAKKAFGEGMETARKQEDLNNIASNVGRNLSIVRNFSGIYLRGKNLVELGKNTKQAITVLNNAGLRPIKDKQDAYSLNAYLLSLPMVFNPADDRKNTYQKPTWAQHVANLSAMYGRDEGTGNPNYMFFNRGGGPYTVDPLNKQDRASNFFSLLLGGPGSGKSATTCALVAQTMAVYRPKMFVVDPGNSMGLLGDYMSRFGVKVAKLSFSPSSKTSLALFKDAAELLQKENIHIEATDIGDMNELISSNKDLEDLKEPEDAKLDRDILGELEIIALIMITGGEQKEYDRYIRADRQLVRTAIIEGARDAVKNNEITRPSHIQKKLEEIANGEFGKYNTERRAKASEMAESLSMWCQPGTFENAVFNTEGEGIPDADLVIIDVASFARSGYEAQMAVAMTGLFQYINNCAERDQHTGRTTAMYIDESHLVTVNPLLSPFIIKCVKMFRKINVMPFFITQNITDFPKESEKLLTMIEWYFVMLASPQEVEIISKYKSLTPEQVNMITSTKKSDKKYTEGTIISKKIQSIFRAVPPSIFLTLAMTDPDEKAERSQRVAKLKRQGLPHEDVDAAIQWAEELDLHRGIA